MIYFILAFLVILSQVLIIQNMDMYRKLKRLRPRTKKRLSDIHYKSPLPPPPSINDMLDVCWNKSDEELECFYPEGKDTRNDAEYILFEIFKTSKCNELKKRGYDLSTLKFSIAPRKGNKKFKSERNKKH